MIYCYCATCGRVRLDNWAACVCGSTRKVRR